MGRVLFFGPAGSTEQDPAYAVDRRDVSQPIVDGNKADSQIELALDGMIADRFTGTAGSIGFVAPGLHRVTARARKGDRDYSASSLINIGPGQICPVKLTLKIP